MHIHLIPAFVITVVAGLIPLSLFGNQNPHPSTTPSDTTPPVVVGKSTIPDDVLQVIDSEVILENSTWTISDDHVGSLNTPGTAIEFDSTTGKAYVSRLSGEGWPDQSTRRELPAAHEVHSSD
ncbi:hypothetical protein [Stomatohabitans albus]|uniref:hypothetical protein n=1 Tax=Stomatohabitans albus TaxID=3110766 RepID=UPI00300D0B71